MEKKRKLRDSPTEKQVILLSAGNVSLNGVLSHWAKRLHNGEIFTKRLENGGTEVGNASDTSFLAKIIMAFRTGDRLWRQTITVTLSIAEKQSCQQGSPQDVVLRGCLDRTLFLSMKPQPRREEGALPPMNPFVLLIP